MNRKVVIKPSKSWRGCILDYRATLYACEVCGIQTATVQFSSIKPEKAFSYIKRWMVKYPGDYVMDCSQIKEEMLLSQFRNQFPQTPDEEKLLENMEHASALAEATAEKDVELMSYHQSKLARIDKENQFHGSA